MKLKMQRLSGEVMNLPAFRDEFRDSYDAVVAKYVQEPDPIKASAALAGLPDGDIRAIRSELDRVETDLRTKYDLVKEVALPTTAKAWHNMIATEGPLMVAKSSEDPSKLVLIVIDMPIG